MVTYYTDENPGREYYSLESARAFTIARLKRKFPRQARIKGECIEGRVTFFRNTKTGSTLAGFLDYSLNYYWDDDFKWGNKMLDEHGKIKR